MGMQAFGAALATVIGQGVSFIISLVYLYKNKNSFGFDFKPESFRMEHSMLTRLMSLGIPMAIQSAAVSMSKIVLTSWINAEGMIYSALSGVYNKVGMMMAIVSNSFTTAGSSMVGQNLGAGKYDRVPKIMKTVSNTGLIISTAVAALVWFFPQAMAEMFTSDAAVLAQASLITMPIILNFYGAATRAAAFSIINGSGNSKLNLLVALIDGIVARVGLAALFGFAFHLGCVGFWYGDALAGFMPMVIGLTFYFSGKWKK